VGKSWKSECSRKNLSFLAIRGAPSRDRASRIEGRARARIVCPVVKRSWGFEDATIFRGAFGGTRPRGPSHSRERSDRLPRSCREASVSRLYSTRGKKPLAFDIGGHWRARRERRNDFGIWKKGGSSPLPFRRSFPEIATASRATSLPAHVRVICG